MWRRGPRRWGPRRRRWWRRRRRRRGLTLTSFFSQRTQSFFFTLKILFVWSARRHPQRCQGIVSDNGPEFVYLFVPFHLQQLSKAAVAFDARAGHQHRDHHAQADGMPLTYGGGGGPSGTRGAAGRRLRRPKATFGSVPCVCARVPFLFQCIDWGRDPGLGWVG